jgi:hypothetical protein
MAKGIIKDEDEDGGWKEEEEKRAESLKFIPISRVSGGSNQEEAKGVS